MVDQDAKVGGRIVVASQNPIKLRAAESGFCAVFPNLAWQIVPVSVPSGVADQPMSDAETLLGACNRAKAARKQDPTARYWAGIEGGIEPTTHGLATFAWVAILAAGGQGFGRTATFFLPESVAELVREGMELGEADDIIFGRQNSKQKEGAIGLLTGGLIDRESLYQPAVVTALIPFSNPELYQ